MIKSCITWIIIMNQHRGTKQITYQPACGWDVTLLRGCFQWKPLNWSCCSRGMRKHLWLLSGCVSFIIYLFILFLVQLGLCSWTWALPSCSEWRSLFTAVAARMQMSSDLLTKHEITSWAALHLRVSSNSAAGRTSGGPKGWSVK